MNNFKHSPKAKKLTTTQLMQLVERDGSVYLIKPGKTADGRPKQDFVHLPNGAKFTYTDGKGTVHILRVTLNGLEGA